MLYVIETDSNGRTIQAGVVGQMQYVTEESKHKLSSEVAGYSGGPLYNHIAPHFAAYETIPIDMGLCWATYAYPYYFLYRGYISEENFSALLPYQDQGDGAWLLLRLPIYTGPVATSSLVGHYGSRSLVDVANESYNDDSVRCGLLNMVHPTPDNPSMEAAADAYLNQFEAEGFSSFAYRDPMCWWSQCKYCWASIEGEAADAPSYRYMHAYMPVATPQFGSYLAFPRDSTEFDVLNFPDNRKNIYNYGGEAYGQYMGESGGRHKQHYYFGGAMECLANAILYGNYSTELLTLYRCKLDSPYAPDIHVWNLPVTICSATEEEQYNCWGTGKHSGSVITRTGVNGSGNKKYYKLTRDSYINCYNNSAVGLEAEAWALNLKRRMQIAAADMQNYWALNTTSTNQYSKFIPVLPARLTAMSHGNKTENDGINVAISFSAGKTTTLSGIYANNMQVSKGSSYTSNKPQRKQLIFATPITTREKKVSYYDRLNYGWQNAATKTNLTAKDAYKIPMPSFERNDADGNIIQTNTKLAYILTETNDPQFTNKNDVSSGRNVTAVFMAQYSARSKMNTGMILPIYNQDSAYTFDPTLDYRQTVLASNYIGYSNSYPSWLEKIPYYSIYNAATYKFNLQFSVPLSYNIQESPKIAGCFAENYWIPALGIVPIEADAACWASIDNAEYYPKITPLGDFNATGYDKGTLNFGSSLLTASTSLKITDYGMFDRAASIPNMLGAHASNLTAPIPSMPAAGVATAATSGLSTESLLYPINYATKLLTSTTHPGPYPVNLANAKDTAYWQFFQSFSTDAPQKKLNDEVASKRDNYMIWYY